MPIIQIRVLNTLVPKSLESNKLPFGNPWQNITKSSKFTKQKPVTKQIAHYSKSNPNYYPSVTSVDSSSIESTCIFPETLNKTHKCMCGKKTEKQQMCKLTLSLS